MFVVFWRTSLVYMYVCTCMYVCTLQSLLYLHLPGYCTTVVAGNVMTVRP